MFHSKKGNRFLIKIIFIYKIMTLAKTAKKI
jgi:hypothetical protein